uniref:Uncharacterized protein n=1 Tax=Heterorhabditis bacteriophora TaxID=37862 RepID=A0A1I7XKD4_HETBA
MATTTKLSFRARNLDANKAMCVYFASELPDLSECAPIARAVAQMPTGMEKEEEMCLQDAQGAVNPYVAFRRRAEKMQTRKNRKNDEDSYEKWREESGSPSESNSSSEWAPPSLGARLAAFAMLSSEEEARTGDHPIARQPPIKESVVGATDIECGNPFLLAPPPVGS